MNHIWPSESQNKKFAQQRAKSGAVTMLNLLRYRESAEYNQAMNETPCSGREAYKRYAQSVFPILEAYKAKMIFAGAAMTTMIGPEDENWDDVLIVEYPSPEAFTQMLSSAEYQGVSYHRDAAVEDSRLICIDTGALKFEDI